MTPSFNGSVRPAFLTDHPYLPSDLGVQHVKRYPPHGSTQRQIIICKACEEHWQSVPKSGRGVDLYMPDLLSSCAAVRTRGCRAEEVIDHPGFPSSRCVPCSDIRLQSVARL